MSITARKNPFRTSQIEALRYLFTKGSWSDFLLQLEHFGNRGAVVGPHGSGKTTLLENFKDLVEARGERVSLVRLNRENTSLSFKNLREIAQTNRQRGWILLDGAEQLSAIGWSIFCILTRRAQGILITTHTESRLPTVWTTDSDQPTVAALLKQLRTDAFSVSPNEIEELFIKHAGNVREILRACYLSAATS